MRTILFGQIQPPRIFLAPDEGGGGGTGAAEIAGGLETMTATGGHPDTTERVPGEVSPNFGKLGGKKTEIPAKKEEKPTETAKKPEEPAKKEEPKVKEEPKKAAAEPQKPASEPKAKETVKPADDKTKKASEAAKPKVEEPKKEEKVEIPDKDDDIDAIQANPGAPSAVVKSLNDMKGIVKQTREAARKVQADLAAANQELEQAKAQIGKLPEDAEAKLKRADEILLTFEAENNEGFRAEYDGKIIKSEENLFALLKHHGLSDDIAKEIKEVGIDNWTQWETFKDKEGNDVPGLLERLSGLNRRKVEDALMARESAITAKREKLQAIAANRDEAMKEFGEKEKQSRAQWADKVAAISNKMFAGEDWILEETVPADATEDEKKAIESSNEEKKKLSATWVKYVQDAYNRNPEKTAELAVKAMKADMLTKQLEDSEGKLERALARVEELEGRLGKARVVGKLAHTDTTDTKPAAQEKKEGGDEIGGDGSSAIRKFPWGQKRK